MVCTCGDPWLDHTIEGECAARFSKCVTAAQKCTDFSLASWDHALVPGDPVVPG